MSDAGIRDVFLGEAREIIENLESDIVQLEEHAGDSEIINRVFRYFHTLKGSSGIVGLTNVYEFTHKLENLLDDVRSGILKVDDKIIDLILSSIDWIRNEIFSGDIDAEKSQNIKLELLKKITGFKGGSIELPKVQLKTAIPDEVKKIEEKFYKISAEFKPSIFEFGTDPLMLIEDLLLVGELIEKKVLKDSLPPFQEMDPEKCYFGWEIVIKTKCNIDKINNVFLFVMDDNKIIITDKTSEFIKASDGEIYETKKLGEILVDKGVITEEQLEEIVEIQDIEKNRLGDLIIKRGIATENEVSEALKEQENIKKKIEVNTIRVDTSKLDNLLNLLGEIVIGQSALSGMANIIDDESAFQLKNALFGLDRATREFQEQIMSIRMVPIGPTFEQFRRFVRDTSHSLGKDIKLFIEGGDVELDKTVIEKIGDPLKHMIRNSIDHGIESAEERKKIGKEPAGSITLKAYHQEGSVFIDVIDDGAGVPLGKVKEKAIKLGHIRADEEISREKLLSLLFLPGLSTASAVGDLSGRGVGMDVVKTNIEELRGIVNFLSEDGKGSTVRIKLPLTMAIIDGMLVNVGDSIYIVPLLSVVESIQPKKEDVKTVEGRGEVIHARGEYVTLIRLYDLFGIKAKFTDPWESLVVIVESGTSKIGLLVDDLIGQQQIVIKSLDNFITKSRAVSGAAILGDGKVALIIDIHGLIMDIQKN